MRTTFRFSFFQAWLWIGVLISSLSASEAKAGSVVSIWFKTPGDKFETGADSSTKGTDSNGNIYYYYTPSRPSVDSPPVCVSPNGLEVNYLYQDQWSRTYYQPGGTFYLWHGRMNVKLTKDGGGGDMYTANDEGEVYISDFPDGTYIVQGYAPLLSAYIATQDGHLNWLGDNGQTPGADLVEYFNVASYLPSTTGKYQAYTWYDLLGPDFYNGWHPYFNGFEFYGGYVAMDVRISAIASQHAARAY